jgi:hypothetical protein
MTRSAEERREQILLSAMRLSEHSLTRADVHELVVATLMTVLDVASDEPDA